MQLQPPVPGPDDEIPRGDHPCRRGWRAAPGSGDQTTGRIRARHERNQCGSARAMRSRHIRDRRASATRQPTSCSRAGRHRPPNPARPADGKSADRRAARAAAGAVTGRFAKAVAVKLEGNAERGKGRHRKFAHRCENAGRQDVIPGGRLLQHAPHALHVFRSPAPVAPGIEISKLQHFRRAGRDARGRGRDLSRHEILAPPGRLVVVGDAAADEEPVRLAIDTAEAGGEGLRAAIRVDGPEGGVLVLGLSFRETKDFRGSGMINARRLVHVAAHSSSASVDAAIS